jgi:LPXTG-site transpeptidase (sortase) family protein
MTTMSPIRWLALGSIVAAVIAAVVLTQGGSTGSGDTSPRTTSVAAPAVTGGSQADSTTTDATSTPSTGSQQPAAADGAASADVDTVEDPGSDPANVEDDPTDSSSDGSTPGDSQAPAANVVPQAPTQAAPADGGVRLRIPALGVDAMVSTLGFDGAGGYAVPNTAGGVGWYDFSAYPGAAGNAVLGGHLNWRGSRGVFDRLDELSSGDMIYVDTAAGEIAYQVVGSTSLAAETPFVEILGERTGPSTLTLFTCGGTFSTAAGSYDHRTVVNAVRV